MLLREKKEIKNWLNQYGIENYKLIENEEYGYVVNCFDDVDLYEKKLKKIEVKFNIVNGTFNCSTNQLVSLEGCPKVVGSSFYCAYNQLKKLKYCPEIVNGNYSCAHNQLTSLEYCPEIIHGTLDIKYNHIVSLENGPKKIGDYLFCNNNDLTIDGIQLLLELNLKGLRIEKNEKLGNIQKILNFNELKKKLEEILKIKEEKENLLELIDKNKEKLNKINKI